MTDKLFFITVGGDSARELLIHANIAQNFNGEVFIFLNPILDEKKRVQRFQAETARALCNLNYHVFRFDYYGTGDSQGELYEFNVTETIADIKEIIDFITTTYSVERVKLLGVRFGADLALLMSSVFPNILDIHLIEPIFNGAKYLRMLRLRRKSFFALRKIFRNNHTILINEEEYEEFQGDLLSKDVISFLDKHILEGLAVQEKNIFLYKLDTIFSNVYVKTFLSEISELNKFHLEQIQLEDFWSSLEYISTEVLTRKISDQVGS